MQPKRMASLAKEAALDIKAEDPVVLDVAKLTSIAHYFVIAHGNSDVHVKAIANNVREKLKAKGVTGIHVEGLEGGQWALIDAGSVLIHIFYKEVRSFYGLERLWGEAAKV